MLNRSAKRNFIASSYLRIKNNSYICARKKEKICQNAKLNTYVFCR